MMTEALEEDGIRDAGPTGRHTTISQHNLFPQTRRSVIFQDSRAPREPCVCSNAALVHSVKEGGEGGGRGTVGGAAIFWKRRDEGRCSLIQTGTGLSLANWHRVGCKSNVHGTAIVLAPCWGFISLNVVIHNGHDSVWPNHTKFLLWSEYSKSIDLLEFRRWFASSKVLMCLNLYMLWSLVRFLLFITVPR